MGSGSAPRTWDIILVNILPHIIASLLERGLQKHLAPGGRMVLDGIIEEREPDVVATLVGYDLKVEQRLVSEDWVALVAANWRER